MAVGQREPIGRDDDAGAGAAALLATSHVDPDDARADLVDGVRDGAGVGVERDAFVDGGGCASAERLGCGVEDVGGSEVFEHEDDMGAGEVGAKIAPSPSYAEGGAAPPSVI